MVKHDDSHDSEAVYEKSEAPIQKVKSIVVLLIGLLAAATTEDNFHRKYY